MRYFHIVFFYTKDVHPATQKGDVINFRFIGQKLFRNKCQIERNKNVLFMQISRDIFNSYNASNFIVMVWE